VDAVYNAINRIVGEPNDLTEFSVQSITRGIDAVGEVTIRIKSGDGRTFTGRGAHPDIVVSSAKAYVNALNRLLVAAERPQLPAEV
jgi:2-isopropylmalate synthase